MKLLVIDSYDSSVYMLVDYPRLLGASATVVRNDAMDLASIFSYDDVLVSPDPGTPAKAGATAAAIRQCTQTKTPMLGVCLGHQVPTEVFGEVVSHTPTLVYGKMSAIRHNSRGLSEELPSPSTVGGYHSLAAEPDTVRELVITARTDDRIVMGVKHAKFPLWGVQFHPESVLTQDGYRIFANQLAVYGQPEALEAAHRKVPLIRFDEQTSQSY